MGAYKLMCQHRWCMRPHQGSEGKEKKWNLAIPLLENPPYCGAMFSGKRNARSDVAAHPIYNSCACFQSWKLNICGQRWVIEIIFLWTALSLRKSPTSPLKYVSLCAFWLVAACVLEEHQSAEGSLQCSQQGWNFSALQINYKYLLIEVNTQDVSNCQQLSSARQALIRASVL